MDAGASSGAGVLVHGSGEPTPSREQGQIAQQSDIKKSDKAKPPALTAPNPKPEATPKLVEQSTAHWVIQQALPVTVEGKPANLGIGLTVVGHSSAS